MIVIAVSPVSWSTFVRYISYIRCCHIRPITRFTSARSPSPYPLPSCRTPSLLNFPKLKEHGRISGVRVHGRQPTDPLRVAVSGDLQQATIAKANRRYLT